MKYEENPLSPEDGYPVRLVVKGMFVTRWVKWVVISKFRSIIRSNANKDLIKYSILSFSG